MAESDLTTPQTLATELGIGAGDPRLPRLISAASGAVRGYLGRRRLHYGSAISEKVAAPAGRERLILDVTPILEVASVTYPGGAVDGWALEDSDLGFLYLAGGWPSTARYRSGLVQDDLRAGSEQASIVVVYEGGWITPAQAASTGWAGPARSLPEEIEEAAIQAAASLYRNPGGYGPIASESLGDYSVSYRAISPGAGGLIPDGIAAHLEQWRRCV